MKLINPSKELVLKVVEFMVDKFGNQYPLIAMTCDEVSILPYSCFRSRDGLEGFQILEMFNGDEPLGLLYCKLDDKGWRVQYRPKERGRQICTALRKMKTAKKRITYIDSCFKEEILDS